MQELKPFNLYAFSIIYDHLNLLLEPKINSNISQIMHAIKRYFSRNANLIINSGEQPHNEGAVCKPRLHSEPRLHSDMDDYFHANGHELNQKLFDYREKFIRLYGQDRYNIPVFAWQKSYYDHVIRGRNDFYNHWRYTAYNHLKHGLPDDWPYTSLEYENMTDGIEW